MHFPPGSKESKEASDQLEKIDREKKRRIPDERHRQRMSALYVEPVSNGSWNQPARKITQEFSQISCAMLLMTILCSMPKIISRETIRSSSSLTPIYFMLWN